MHMSGEALRRGDLVEVRSPGAILATLDGRGALEDLPFMPEMAAYCGRRFVVDSRAQRVCDTVAYSGSRDMAGTVLLGDLRCSGAAHGGCQAECRLFWKEDWLRKVTPETPAAGLFARSDMDALLERTRRHASQAIEGDKEREDRWRCQATEIPRATRHIKFWDARSFVREYLTRNVGLGRFVRVSARAALRETMRKLGLVPKVHLVGTRTGPAAADPPLDLQPGDVVEVKSRAEIAATLNREGKHRGLWFDREMMPFCGGTFRVRQRIERFIDDRDGRMIELKNDCVTLEGSVCSGDHSLQRWFCPRAIYPYWRECWLRRAEGTAYPEAPAARAAGE
jgi:hypothetical protein